MANILQSPGSFLALMMEKYRLNPFKVSQDIHLSPSAVRLITIGKTKITTSVAMRLAKYFNTNPEFWLAMQMKWDVAEASKDKALMKVVKSISRVTKGAPSGGGKSAVAKKTAAAKKPVAKKKTVKTKKPVTGKKTTAAKRPVARKKAAAKRPVAKRKVITAKKRVAAKKPAVKTRKRPAAARAKSVGRRGRSAGK